MSILKNYDIFFILRLVSTDLITTILPMIRKLHRKIVYAMDDDFSKIDASTHFSNQLIQSKQHTNAYKIINLVDYTLVFSKGLYDNYHTYTKNIKFLHGPANFKIIDNINSTVLNKNKLILGYAANDHHLSNFKVVIEALKIILVTYKSKIQFECYFSSKPKEFREFSNFICLGRIAGLDAFYNSISTRGWDVGIAPLVINEFNKAKSDVKYREYSSLKIAGVYSDITAYNQSVINNETGILVNNTTQEWFNGIKMLLDNKELRNSIITKANIEIRDRCKLENISMGYIEVFKEVLK
jgi:hypothetical protein